MIDMDKEGTGVLQSLITDVQQRYKVYTKEMLNKRSHYGGIWYKSLIWRDPVENNRRRAPERNHFQPGFRLPVDLVIMLLPLLLGPGAE